MRGDKRNTVLELPSPQVRVRLAGVTMRHLNILVEYGTLSNGTKFCMARQHASWLPPLDYSDKPSFGAKPRWLECVSSL